MGLGNWVLHLRRKMRVSLQEGDEEEANLITVQLDPLGANNSQKCQGSCNKFFMFFPFLWCPSESYQISVNELINTMNQAISQSMNE